MTRLRFGLLGTGYWAIEAHGAALVSSPYAELTGVWGRDPAKAERAAGQLGATSYADLGELLLSVDAVAIAVPPDVQAVLALRAARAGRHLLLEKPLALDVHAAEALARSTDEAGVACVIFFTHRFNSVIERWATEAATAGPWHSAHLVHYANIFQPGDPFGHSLWRRERGALWDVGPHGLASILPIMGRVSSVAAWRGPSGSDTVHVVLSHGGRSASTMSLSLTMPPAAGANSLTLYGEKGVWRRPESPVETREALGLAIHDLANMVATGERRHRCDASFGLEVVRVLAAAEQALELPAAVELR